MPKRLNQSKGTPFYCGNAHCSSIPVKNGTKFFSYSTPIAAMVGRKLYVTTEKYSNTTTRHLNAFVDWAEENGADTTVRVDEQYLRDLN